MPDTRLTTCPMDCPDACTLAVTVEAGRVVSLDGVDDGHPTTAGFICGKVRRFAERQEHAERIHRPLRRTGPKGSGRFEPIGWDEALDEVVRRFRGVIAEHGAEAILPYAYGGSNGFISHGLVDEYFFARLGASRLKRTLCAAPSGAAATAMYGKMPGVAPEDYVHARLIVVWGANPRASQIHLVPFLHEARRRGARVVTVDPRRVLADREVDLSLQPRPGTDLPLALGLIAELERLGAVDHDFLARHATGADRLLGVAREWTLQRAAEVSGVPEGSIAELARLWAGASPAVMRCGWGVERNLNGAQAVAAILAIPALTGKFGVRGGGYTLSNSGAARLDTSRFFAGLTWSTRSLNMSRLGALLQGPLDPPVKALFVYNCNPVATAPDQNAIVAGLRREDLFTVVHEQVMTDTAALADLVLPATTFLEAHDVRRGYGSYVIGGVVPVVPAAGEAWSNHRLFSTLGQAFGFEDPQFRRSPEELVHQVAAGLDVEVDPATLLSGRVARYSFPGPAPVQFQTVFPRTPTGKADLAPAALGDRPFQHVDVKEEGFPLAMISPASPHLISSTFGEFNLPELVVELSPEDAARRHISDGDMVRAFNPLGEVILRARVSRTIRQGTVSMNKGAWGRATRNGRTAVALCPAHVEPVSGGACFNDARVDVERWSAPAT